MPRKAVYGKVMRTVQIKLPDEVIVEMEKEGSVSEVGRKVLTEHFTSEGTEVELPAEWIPKLEKRGDGNVNAGLRDLLTEYDRLSSAPVQAERKTLLRGAVKPEVKQVPYEPGGQYTTRLETDEEWDARAYDYFRKVKQINKPTWPALRNWREKNPKKTLTVLKNCN